MKTGLTMAKLSEYRIVISKNNYVFSNTDV